MINDYSVTINCYRLPINDYYRLLAINDYWRLLTIIDDYQGLLTINSCRLKIAKQV